jgi:hypothetical protein
MKVAIIGAGNMGGAIARGLANGHYIQAQEISVSNPSAGKLDALKAEFPAIHVTHSNKEAAEDADIIIIAVKPWKVEEVLKPLRLRGPQILVSVAAGLTFEDLAHFVDPEMPMFRVIPNTAISEGASMTLIAARNASEEQITSLTALFNEKGVPTAVNGKQMKMSDVVRELNRLGGKHGVGIVDIVENRVVGMKSRGVYETPGGTILLAAHKQLEELILDRDTLAFKKTVSDKYADLVYEGKWFCPLREALQAFIESTQDRITGEVKFKLYKGNIIKAGTTSPYTLYSESLASFTTGDLYDHHDAEGFIHLFGLSMKVRAMLDQKREEKDKNNNK